MKGTERIQWVRCTTCGARMGEPCTLLGNDRIKLSWAESHAARWEKELKLPKDFGKSIPLTPRETGARKGKVKRG